MTLNIELRVLDLHYNAWLSYVEAIPTSATENGYGKLFQTSSSNKLSSELFIVTYTIGERLDLDLSIFVVVFVRFIQDVTFHF